MEGRDGERRWKEGMEGGAEGGDGCVMSVDQLPTMQMGTNETKIGKGARGTTVKGPVFNPRPIKKQKQQPPSKKSKKAVTAAWPVLRMVPGTGAQALDRAETAQGACLAGSPGLAPPLSSQVPCLERDIASFFPCPSFFCRHLSDHWGPAILSVPGTGGVVGSPGSPQRVGTLCLMSMIWACLCGVGSCGAMRAWT